MRPLPSGGRWLLATLVVALIAAPVAAAAPAGGGPTDGPAAASTPSSPGPLPDALADPTPPSPWSAGAATGPDRAGPGPGAVLGDRLAAGDVSGGAVGWELPLSVLLAGYTRQVDDAPLEHAVRQRVYDRVADAPGDHIAGIVDATGVPRSTVRYHLRVLEDAGLVAGAMVRGKHRYAPAGDDLHLGAALRDAPVRRVLEAVATLEPASVTDLADAVDRSPSTVSHHLGHLAETGLVDRGRSADARVRLAPERRAALQDRLDRLPRAAAVEVHAE